MVAKQEAVREPNWTELLEKEFGKAYPDIIRGMRADGHPDKETYELLDTWG